MAEVEISPLAKRLAEENNVNWRSLSGSGDEGRIVERDVLDYLARVMAGDEASDPTPEPMPDGMEQWPDQPGIASTDSSRKEHVSSEESWQGDDGLLEVESVGEPAPAAANEEDEDGWSPGDWGNGDWGQTSGSGGEAEAVDTGGFFGTDDLSEARSSSGYRDEATIDFGNGSGGDDYDFGAASLEPPIDEGIFVFDDEDSAPAGGAQAGVGGEQAEDNLFDLDEEEQPVAESPGVHSSRAEENDFDAEHTPSEGFAASSAEVEEEVAASTEDGSPWEGAHGDSDESELPANDAPWTAVAEEHDLTEQNTPSPWGESAEGAVEPETVSHWQDDPGDAEPELQESTTPAAAEITQRESATPAAAEITQPESGEEYGYLDRLSGSLPDGVRIEEDEYRVRRSATDSALAAQAAAGNGAETAGVAEVAPAASPSSTGRGVVAGGIVLRRDVDLTAVVQARQAVTAELGEQGSLAAFLLRAAARAGKPWPLQSEGAQVGLASLSDDAVGVSVVADAGLLPFRDLIQACASGTDVGGRASLVVADLSEMGIDEAVLDLGLPVLTVGRVLEESNGRFHATLTLSGLSTPEAGSRFLGRVVELLAAPVRLVL